MGIDTGVTRRSCQIFVLPVGDVKVALRVTVLLGQTKVDHIHLVSALANAHQKVVGFDVTVNKVLGVDVFDARDLNWVSRRHVKHRENERMLVHVLQ